MPEEYKGAPAIAYKNFLLDVWPLYLLDQRIRQSARYCMYDKLTGGIVFDVDVPQAEIKAVKSSRVYDLPVSRSSPLRSRSIK
jgi:hypothetical protein